MSRHSIVFAIASALLAACSGGTAQPQHATVAISVTPSDLSVAAGASRQLSASVTGAADASVGWSLDEAAGGTISDTGLYTAPAAAGTFHARATAHADATRSALATIVVTAASAVVPTIESFTANPKTVISGSTSTLTWSALGATSVTIDHGIGAVSTGSVTLTPDVTTTYTITASSAAGSVSASTTITVLRKPVIASFAASPAAINSGASSLLSWSVSDADSLSIDQGVGAVTGASKTVTPAATTLYTLTATNAAGTTTAAVNVSVAPPGSPVIASFAATPANLNIGQSTSLAWSVTGATSLSIDGGVGAVTGSSKSVTPSATTTYTLTATNAVGTVSANVTVSVLQKPVISSFAAAPASIVAGATSTLSWTVSGATGLSISGGVGSVTGASAIVTPSATTAYTLTATNAAGSTTAAATVTVTAAPAKPVITSFAASPASIASGASSTLSWVVAGATSLSINNAVGAVTGTSRSVTPAATTTYTLSATNAAGTSNASATVTVTGTGAKPVIASFTSSASPVANGGPVTLAWSVTNAATLTIDGGSGGGFSGAVTGNSKVVNPTASTTYRLTATSTGGTTVAATSVTVHPTAPKPVISSFTADSLQVPAGGTTTLRWAPIANATNVQIDSGVGTVNGINLIATPALSATTTFLLTATNASGSASASVTVAVNAGTYAAPTPPGGTPAVTLTLDSGAAVHPISKFVYGYNATSLAQAPSGTTYLRLGGNRWTAYNWENNASNAGSDYIFESDDYLGGGNTPGEAVRPTIAATQSGNLGVLVTLPMQGWVAADKNGTSVSTTAPQSDRFYQTLPRKAAPFDASPDTSDRFVFQDEYVNSLLGQFPTAFADAQKPIHFSLDNEPDLWSGTHAEIQRGEITYAGFTRQSLDLAAAVKDVIPQAMVFGPVSYGFNGYVNLQNATDATPNEWFLDYYLRQAKAASVANGRRLVDVLDLHWYTEATGGGVKVNDANQTAATRNSAVVRAARVQSTRSLWESGYKETSWVADYIGGPIQLLPTLKTKIAAQFPGTKIAFTEYNHGGGDDISGAVAEADTLGIFGRDGVYAATYWELLGDDRFTHAAFRAFRNYNGAGGTFGDTSFSAVSTDNSKASVYASMDAGHPERVVLVVTNKTAGALDLQIKLTHTQPLNTAQIYRVTSASNYTAPNGSVPGYVVPTLVSASTPVAGNAFNLAAVPGYSVTTIVLQ